jgi:hypothetical protein
VDNTNGGELLGSAYRNAKEEDLDINGNQFSGSGVPTIPTGGGGGIGNGGGGGKLPTKSPAPSGCEQPPPQCVWSPDPSPPLGWQSYGSVTLESGTLNLYCLAGTAVSQDLGCDFLQRWACFGGVCSPNPNGSYASQSECEAALIPPPFTGGQCAFAYIYVLQRTGPDGTKYLGLVNANNGTVTVPLFNLSDAIAGARGGSSSDVYKPSGIISIITVGATTTVTVGFERPLGNPRTQGINLPANDGLPTFRPYTYSLQGVYPRNPSDTDNCGDAPSTCGV